MTLPKYVTRRGGIYQFNRRVPQDIVDVIGKKFWRVTLDTDSLSEAEAKSHREIILTDEMIDAARSGTFRKIDDDTLFGWAIAWSSWFNENAQITLPEAVFGARFPDAFAHNSKPIGDEIADPIIRSREQLETHVREFIGHADLSIDIPSPDWKKLIDDCQDHYHYGNPEVSTAEYFGTIGPVEKQSDNTRIQSIFGAFKSERTRADAENPVTEGTLKDYAVAVERFVEVFGDKPVGLITRSDAEQFRNLLRRLPSRPPNNIRELPIEDQADWAEQSGHKLLARETVAKLITGMLSILNYAFHRTAAIEDRKNWENPFKGFAGTGKRTGSAQRLAFEPEHLPRIFDPSIYRPRKPSHFWVPLLLCFTGARRDEISQLHLSDVYLEAEVPHFKFTEELDSAIDLTKTPKAVKRLKTSSSERVAPIHHALFEMGFLDLIDWARRENDIHLFPDLPHEKGNDRSNKLSTFFTQHLRNKVGLSDSRYVLHSFRHGFSTMAIKSDVSDDRRKLAGGWYVGDDVSVARYALHFREDASAIKRQVHDKIDFPRLDTDALKENHLRALRYRC